jgi:hypothetical protein
MKSGCWDSNPPNGMINELDLSHDSKVYQPAIYHTRRGEADYFLIEGSLMSGANTSGLQFSMLVTSPVLGLPRMVLMPKLQFSGLMGRLFDEVIERIPLGSLQRMELEQSEEFHLFSNSPLQATAFFDKWRLARLDALSHVFVSCDGDSFLCSIVELDPDRLKHTSTSAGLNRLFEAAQRIFSGLSS